MRHSITGDVCAPVYIERIGSRRAFWITVAAIAAVVAVVAAVFAVLSDKAGRFEQAIDDECTPLVVLAFRGSGESNLTPEVTSNLGAPYRYGESDLVTNGWEGATLRRLFDALANTEYEGLRGDEIPVVPIGPAGTDELYGYDAIAADIEASSIDSAFTFSSSKLLYSASGGAEAATLLIQQYLRDADGCPVPPSFVLTGYSQGAMAARHTAELNPDSALGVITIGDPYQMPDAPGVRADAAGGGILRWNAGDAQREQLDAYYEGGELRSAICHPGDPICAFAPMESLAQLATGDFGEHLDYYTDGYPDEAADDARAIVRLAYERRALAEEAFDEGRTVEWDQAELAAGHARVRALSLSFAGTPTLISAITPGDYGRGLRYEFDLDGDGVFETLSPDGTIWVTFDDDGPRTIEIKVTDPDSGRSDESSTTVVVAPEEDGEIVFDPEALSALSGR